MKLLKVEIYAIYLYNLLTSVSNLEEKCLGKTWGPGIELESCTVQLGAKKRLGYCCSGRCMTPVKVLEFCPPDGQK